MIFTPKKKKNSYHISRHTLFYNELKYFLINILANSIPTIYGH